MKLSRKFCAIYISRLILDTQKYHLALMNATEIEARDINAAGFFWNYWRQNV